MVSGDIQIRVRYAETDRMGLLHHANYLIYFEQGRTELLRSRGINYKDLEDQGYLLVLTRVEVRYRSPARYDDLLTLRTTVVRTTLVKIEHRYELLRDGTLAYGVLIAALFAGEFVLIYEGLVLTTAARAVLFVYTAPFVVALGAHFFVPGERLSGLKALGLACAFVGIAVAFADALRLPTRRELAGDLLELGGAVCWGATTVVIKASRHAHLTPNKTLFYQLAGSAMVLLPLAAAVGEPGVVDPTPLALMALGYQIVAVAFASYLTWFWLLARYPAAELSAFSFFTPLFGMLAGGLILGERIGPALALAMALVAAGLYLVNRPARAIPEASAR